MLEDLADNEHIQKVERLACLYLTFLNHPQGLSFARIRELIPLAYQHDPETGRRKFERDKEELCKLGMELQHYGDGETLPDGGMAEGHVYIPKDEIQQLPELHLTANESHVLATLLAGAIETQGGEERALVQQLESAAAKLLYKSPSAMLDIDVSRNNAATLPMEQSQLFSQHLAALHEALLKRRVVRLSYPGRGGEATEREVEGRGLIAYRGRWYFVAFCRRAGDIRSFYIDRILESEVLEEVYKSDVNFDLKNYTIHPLAVFLHDPVLVRVQIHPDKEEAFGDFCAGIPKRLVFEVRDDVYHFETTNTGALYSWIVRNPGGALRLSPPEVLLGFEDYLRTMKMRHA